MKRLIVGLALASCSLQALPSMAQSREPIFIPRVVLPPPPPRSETPPRGTPDGPGRAEGAAVPDVDSSTFDMFAQMVRRFNSLERRLDQLATQNAALAQQLAEARRAVDESDQRLRGLISVASRDSSGRTLINLVGRTCAMLDEALARLRSPDIGGGFLVEATTERPGWREYMTRAC